MKGLDLEALFRSATINSSSANLEQRIVLYILRVTAVITSLKLLAVLPVYIYDQALFTYATFCFVVSVVLSVYLFLWAENPRGVLKASLMLYTGYVVVLMFFTDFKMSIISIQHMFLVIMIAFYGLNRVAGISYAVLFVVIVLVFILKHKSELNDFHLFPDNFPLINMTFVIAANFCLICYIHYYYNLSLNKSLDKVRSLNKKLKSSLNAKSDFLSTMSHELRTPLNSVIGTAYLLGNSNIDEQQRKNIHALRFSAESILILVNDILDYSKMDSHHTKLESIPFSLNAQIKNIFSGFEQKTNEKSLDFQLWVEPSLENTWLIGDPNRLTQIMYNLIGNAIKFTELGGVSVVIKELKKEGDWVTIGFFVNDTGIGIEESYFDKLFQPFTQGHSSINRKYGGTGLGLTIVNHLVKLHGGRIDIKSKIGEGTKIAVEIQYEITQNVASKLSKEVSLDSNSQEDAKILEDDLSDIRVMLAEDNEMAILFMKQLLKKWEISPFIARDGEEALEIFQKESIDLVLMDIHMPKLNGSDATLKIRELEKDRFQSAYIIALTASVSDTFAGKYQEVGFNDYLKKPFRPNDLLNKIQKGKQELQNSKMEIVKDIHAEK